MEQLVKHGFIVSAGALIFFFGLTVIYSIQCMSSRRIQSDFDFQRMFSIATVICAVYGDRVRSSVWIYQTTSRLEKNEIGRIFT